MDRLREFRKSHNLTQEAMANKLGITVSMYEKVEGGRANASSAFMKRIKRAFPEVNIDIIFFAIDSNISAVELLENEKTPTGSQA